jgi:hypothetical protein
MPPIGFEPATPTSDRPQILALDRSATGVARFKPRTVQPVATSCTHYANSAPKGRNISNPLSKYAYRPAFVTPISVQAPNLLALDTSTDFFKHLNLKTWKTG